MINFKLFIQIKISIKPKTLLEIEEFFKAKARSHIYHFLDYSISPSG